MAKQGVCKFCTQSEEGACNIDNVRANSFSQKNAVLHNHSAPCTWKFALGAFYAPNIQSFDMQIHLWDAAYKISKRGPKVPREPLCVGSHFADPRCKREQFADLKCAAVDKIPSFRPVEEIFRINIFALRVEALHGRMVHEAE